MRILITGGRNGFLSNHLLTHFRKNTDFSVYSCSRNGDVLPQKHAFHPLLSGDFADFKCDITDTQQVKCLMEVVKPDCVMHLAAIPTVKPNSEDPFEITRTNVEGTHKLLEYCPKGCIFILASSVVVYGNTRERVSDIERVELRPTSVYGVTKLASEALVQAYHAQGKVYGRILRLCATVGKGLTHGIVKDFMKKVDSVEAELEILGKSPGSIKPFSHIDDVISAFDIALNYYKTDCLVANVVPTDEISCERVADTVMCAMAKFKIIRFLGESSNWKGDNSLIQVYADKLPYLGWEPKYKRSEAAVEAAVRDIIKKEV